MIGTVDMTMWIGETSQGSPLDEELWAINRFWEKNSMFSKDELSDRLSDPEQLP